MPSIGSLASVNAQSSAIAFIDEATTTSDNIIYTISDSAKELWDLDTAIVVKDTAVVTVENYSIDRLNGTITFDTATSRTITVSGSYVVTTLIAEADEYSFNGETDAKESTVFLQNYKSYETGVLNATVSISKFKVDDAYLTILLSKDRVILELNIDSTNTIKMFAVLTSVESNATIEELERESLQYQVTSAISYVEG